MTMINFNEAPVCGTELDHIRNAIADRHICGDGTFTKQCNKFLEGYTKCKKALLTNSCTAALEMSALLLDIQPGDEDYLSFLYVYNNSILFCFAAEQNLFSSIFVMIL